MGKVMYKIVPDYDDKYCACRIEMPKEFETKQFETKYEALTEAYMSFALRREPLKCDPPIFTHYYARPYADALKSKQYTFDSLKLYVLGGQMQEGVDYITVDCMVDLGAERVETTLIFKAVEV